jgi:transforming growth factor-beta-induced protein
MTFLKFNLLSILLLSLFVMSCGDDDGITIFPEEGEEQQEEELSNTIVDIASGDAQFSTLVAAVQKAGLVETLSGEGAFTVFAPTNDAFSALLTDLGVGSLDDLADDAVANILLYHVLGDIVESPELSNGYVSTVNTSGPDGNAVSLLVNVDSGVTLNGTTSVTTADLNADNGIIHVVDQVLVPPTVVDIAINNSMFSSLVSAVVAADLVEALTAEGPFTVFAPTNDAFAELLTNLGVSSVEEIPVETLTSVLLHHVVSGNVLSSDLVNGSVPTLNETNMIDVNIDNGVVLNGEVNVRAADVQGINGVVHVIDKVLVPEF